MYSHEENFNIKRIQLNYRKQQLSNLHQPKLKKKKKYIHTHPCENHTFNIT